jgi:hypothetical protein
MRHTPLSTEMKPGAVVNGWSANHLPVGSRICPVGPGMEADASSPLTKVDDETLNPGWARTGRPAWGIDLDVNWLILSVAQRPGRSTEEG